MSPAFRAPPDLVEAEPPQVAPLSDQERERLDLAARIAALEEARPAADEIPAAPPLLRGFLVTVYTLLLAWLALLSAYPDLLLMMALSLLDAAGVAPSEAWAPAEAVGGLSPPLLYCATGILGLGLGADELIRPLITATATRIAGRRQP